MLALYYLDDEKQLCHDKYCMKMKIEHSMLVGSPTLISAFARSNIQFQYQPALAPVHLFFDACTCLRNFEMKKSLRGSLVSEAMCSDIKYRSNMNGL